MPTPSAIPPLRAIVFDLDDTLYPERQYVHSGYRAIEAHLHSRLGMEGHFADWLWARFEAGQASGAFDAMSDAFALDLSAEQIGQLVEVYRHHRPRLKAYEGVTPMLESLARFRPLGLVSDGFLPAQSLKLDAVGLRGFFQAVVFTEAMGREFWKPSLAGFKRIADQLGVDHSQCCYVGDNPAKDFVAPRQLGWRTVQLKLPGQVHSHKAAPADGEPEAIVHSIQSLETLLTSLAGL
jgi:putative hydrolase of the HAD superfamily